MKTSNKLNTLLILVVTVFISLACGGNGATSITGDGNQRDQAFKIVEIANKKLEESKDLYAKTELRNKALFDVDIKTLPEFETYKGKMSDEAKSIVADYEKVADMLKDVSRQYADVSRLDVGEKYKDYARLKSDEYARRSEAVNIRKGNPQALIDFDDPKAMVTKFDENSVKSDRLFKDAEDLGARAKKIEEDNKDLF